MPREHLSVAELAYRLWEARGRPAGSAELDWEEAERQLAGHEAATPSVSKTGDDSLKDTFPGSDPPASHIPDEPPANADAKWEAAGVSRSVAQARRPTSSKDKRGATE